MQHGRRLRVEVEVLQGGVLVDPSVGHRLVFLFAAEAVPVVELHNGEAVPHAAEKLFDCGRHIHLPRLRNGTRDGPLAPDTDGLARQVLEGYVQEMVSHKLWRHRHGKDKHTSSSPRTLEHPQPKIQHRCHGKGPPSAPLQGVGGAVVENLGDDDLVQALGGQLPPLLRLDEPHPKHRPFRLGEADREDRLVDGAVRAVGPLDVHVWCHGWFSRSQEEVKAGREQRKTV